MVFRIGSLFILDSDMEVVMPVIAFNTERWQFWAILLSRPHLRQLY